MKRIINATNGSLEFDNAEEIQSVKTFINAPSVYVKLINGNPATSSFKAGDQILAVHIVGKNTHATPNFSIQSRQVEATSSTNFNRAGQPVAWYAPSIEGITDINWLYGPGEINPVALFLDVYSEVTYDYQASGNFTGYLHITVYYKRFSR